MLEHKQHNTALKASTRPFLTRDQLSLHLLLHPGREHRPFCLWEYGDTQIKGPLQTCACRSFEVSSQITCSTPQNKTVYGLRALKPHQFALAQVSTQVFPPLFNPLSLS